MSKLTEIKKVRTAAIVMCGAMLAVLPAIAQQDAPPPPPQDQTQGPPQGGGPHGRGGMNPEHRVEMLRHELNLTPAQTTQVRGILEEGHRKLEALRADTSPEDNRRMRVMEIMNHETEQVRSVLTPDQQPKYDAIVERQRERMRDHREGGPGGPPPPPQGQQPPSPPQQ